MRFFLFTLLGLILSVDAMGKTSVLLRASAGLNNSEPSFFDKGNGIFRSHNGSLLLNQAIVASDFDLPGPLSFHSVVNGYSDGDKNIGITQAFFTYKPLSPNTYTLSSRAGFFYPKLSVENTDIGWLSKHFINSSAINSWIGEELRVPGLEITLSRSARKAKSPWSLKFTSAIFKGNDTTGTLLAWRGFALHDRQTLHHERVEFANLPSVTNPEPFNAPSWTEPFTEIDGRTGYYLGTQAQYRRQLDIRYFYYDNRANPLIVNEQRLYAWRTRFHSLASRYLVNKQTEISFHFMVGTTEMGKRQVYADFLAAYLAYSRQQGSHRYSMRLDVFDVKEDDYLPSDYNDSHGIAITTNWSYALSKSWSASLEAVYAKHRFENRRSLGVLPTQSDTQAQLAVTFRK